jgi:hypothetical protein
MKDLFRKFIQVLLKFSRFKESDIKSCSKMNEEDLKILKNLKETDPDLQPEDVTHLFDNYPQVRVKYEFRRMGMKDTDI